MSEIINAQNEAVMAKEEALQQAPPPTTYYETEICTDEKYQAFIAGVHSIKEEVFKEMIQAYIDFYTTPGQTPKSTGKEYATGVITGIIGAGTCNDTRLVIDEVNGSRVNDEDINVSWDRLKRPDKTYYSVTLFKGVIDLINPDKFVFYKGMKKPGEVEIIFKALDTAGNVKYYGDISGLP